MVTEAQAKCEQKKWFDEKRCKNFNTCSDCDFKDLPFEKIDIERQLNKERLELKGLISDKKIAKQADDKEKIKEIELLMVDKTVGVVIMQDTLVKKFGLKGFGSALDYIRAKRELRKWQNQLK